MITFRELKSSDAGQILKWRTSASVTDFMTTDLDGDLKSQEVWIRNSFSKTNYYHWIIVIDKVDVGLLSISDLNLQDGCVSWGYYIAEPDFFGLGGMIPPFLYNFVFAELPIVKIKVEVFESNHQVLMMHKLHGYVREPNLDRIIEKNGSQHKLLAMSLSSLDWLSRKAFHKLITEFPTKLWLCSPINR